MKKKTLAVLLSATLVTSSTTTVFAKDITVTIPNYASDEGNSNLPEAAETVTILMVQLLTLLIKSSKRNGRNT